MNFDAEQLDARRWRISVSGEQFLARPDLARYGTALGEVEIHWTETDPPQPTRMELVAPRDGRRYMPRGPLTPAAKEPTVDQALVVASFLEDAAREVLLLDRTVEERNELIRRLQELADELGGSSVPRFRTAR